MSTSRPNLNPIAGFDCLSEDSGSVSRLAPEKTETKVLVLDTSALVMGLNPSALNLPSYSVTSVLDELTPNTLPHTRFVTSRDSGHLTLKKPTPSSMKTVQETSSRVGDAVVLSRADIEVLALALDLKKDGLSPAVVSDDYAIQNVSETLSIEHASLATFGIAQKFDWIYYCPACFRRYTTEDADQTCRVCGTPLKRKVVRKGKAIRKIGRS
jgi:endoribonuclease Nob1